MGKYGYYVVYVAKKANVMGVSITGGATMIVNFKIDSDIGMKRVQGYLEKSGELSEVVILNWRRIKIYEENVKSVETTSAAKVG